ncbi:sulfite exporter TauE/SafE family protein [Thiocapsa sp. UBA6158]|uniref:sulfite exporter TauE/SafE family protein n=1 Tax=Thiocapsa sp. UBA6158 TaxID=1947692 RepID=UPI0025D7CDD1|nr:sulfite exporter TauE/SafE family protein [Thiocapsa sp. UBA6158]
MSDLTPSASAETTAKLFRGRVLKPAEGVFLFHPRAIERLIIDHLATEARDISIPELAYYLMPSTAFLTGLESENPEALAVIEGLNLPDYVILLPIPPEQRLDRVGFTRLLRDYWARRFEAEVARAWQIARDDNLDGDPFGPIGLTRRIGPLALAEVRDIMTRDGVVPAGIGDAFICRSFVALIARLRYFSPGARGFFFPTIRNWDALDLWLIESGLDLPGSLQGGRLPRLLEHTRPDHRCGVPEYLPLLPSGLPYGESDPDFARAIAARQNHETPLVPDEPASQDVADTAISSPVDEIEARCLAVLREASQLARRDWKTRLRDIAITPVAPLLDALLAIPGRLSRKRSEAGPRGIWLDLHLALFADAVRKAQRAELDDHYAAALVNLALARRRFIAMGEPCLDARDAVRAILAQRAVAAQSTLADLIAANSKLSPDTARELSALTALLGEEVMRAGSARSAYLILRDLERVLLESRTTYYRLRPFHWAASGGKERLRQILPFQARLKALRALAVASSRLEQIEWPTREVERFSVPLKRLSEQLSTRLAGQIRPHLRASLEEAGFNPTNHRERVAAHKMREELLDVIQHRRHLKFTDVRDIVARNILRLPDPTLEEIRHGDRLAHFDRIAARNLPGVYKPGEFYVKGLQQLGAPLFGTPRGRLILRHLILPTGLAYLGLKTLDILAGLIAPEGSAIDLAPLWLVLLLALLINAFAYTRVGRAIAKSIWRVIAWTVRLLLFDGMRRLLRWAPVARLLSTSLIRGLDRNLVQPLFIGLLIVLPFVGLGLLIDGVEIDYGLSLLIPAFAIGTLARNTPAGRRMLDNAASAAWQMLRRLNQTLVIGLVRELLHFFKEVTRRFEQGLHRIEELLSHQLGESRLALVVKALFAPVWNFTESVIQFYVTVLVEPQVNPIKHFPLVTIAHKLMLPFLPALTGLLVALTEPFLPKLIAYPFVTVTILLLPGLAGFLVWELKENRRIYAANHAGANPVGDDTARIEAVRRSDLSSTPIEPAVIGSHGETMRGMLRRGFHSGTLPKAFDRLRRVLREEIRDEVPYPHRLREAQRRLAEVERALCVFCDRELGYALRRRCAEPNCGLVSVETGRPRLSSNAFDLTLELYAADTADNRPIELRLCIYLEEPDLFLKVEVSGPKEELGAPCWALVRSDLEVFSGRAGIRQAPSAV